MIDENIIAKMIEVSVDKDESDLLRCLEKKITLAEDAGNYKAQADYWKEQYEQLRKQCYRVIQIQGGIDRLNKYLEDDMGSLIN